MQDKSQLEKISADDLLRELRAREAQSSGNKVKHLEMAVSQLQEFETALIRDVLRDKQKLIYGVDDRKDLYAVSDKAILQDADSVVALIDKQQITDNGDGTSTISGTKFAVFQKLCVDEPFREQICAGFCSGFLVAEDVIATAGHCVTNSSPLENTRFVFGFKMLSPTTVQNIIPNTEIYIGVEVLGRQYSPTGTDWALIRLERRVPNHSVVRIRKVGKVSSDQTLHVIGHPVGLPAKFADGAVVRQNSDPDYFVANLDTYGGNSGSPVFNSDDHTVEGILVRGATDFVSVGTCNVTNVCPTSGCSGESVTRTTEFSGLLEE